MGRKEKSLANLVQKWEKQPLREGAVRPRAGRRPKKLDDVEKMSAVCELICSGLPMSEVRREMEELYGRAGWISREDTYNLLSRAAHLGWLSYRPPRHREHAQRLLDEHAWLQGAQVVHTASVAAVAKAAAQTVFEVLTGYGRHSEVHIGLAGGFTVRRIVEELARLLCDAPPSRDLPALIVLHSLGAGSDGETPAADPTTFFGFFENEPDLRTAVEFVGFRGPQVAHTEHAEILRNLPGVRETFEDAEEIDIVVTSGAQWTDKHSLLRQLLEVDERSIDQLEHAGCVGDMMGRPVGPDGSLDGDTPTQAFTLFELSDLARMVRRGKHVVFALGPCAACQSPKGELLKAVLECDPPLITHVVTDSRTARECLEAAQAG